MKTFWEHFRYSLDCLGLPAPQSLFGSAVLAVGTIRQLSQAVEKYGTTVTIAQIIRTVPAGYFSNAFVLEFSSLFITCTAAYYAGACIGALAYATGQYSSERLFSYNQAIDSCYNKGIKVPINLKNYINSNEFLKNKKVSEFIQNQQAMAV